MELTTDRLHIRPFTEVDAADFYAMQKDPAVNRFLPWFAPTNETEALALLHRQYLDVEDGVHVAVCDLVTDRPIGYLNVDTGDNDLGYGLVQSHWGQGLITEATTALVTELPADYAFLTATHDVQNPKSGAVMRRLGMQYQYTYLEQWQPKNIPVHFRLYLLNRDGNTARTFPKYWNTSAEHFVEADLT